MCGNDICVGTQLHSMLPARRPESETSSHWASPQAAHAGALWLHSGMHDVVDPFHVEPLDQLELSLQRLANEMARRRAAGAAVADAAEIMRGESAEDQTGTTSEQQTLQEELKSLHGSDPLLDHLLKKGPVTRESYLTFAYPDGVPDPLPAELEAQLPRPLQK